MEAYVYDFPSESTNITLTNIFQKRKNRHGIPLSQIRNRCISHLEATHTKNIKSTEYRLQTMSMEYDTTNSSL